LKNDKSKKVVVVVVVVVVEVVVIVLVFVVVVYSCLCKNLHIKNKTPKIKKNPKHFLFTYFLNNRKNEMTEIRKIF